jgi:hypothetical protein
MAGLVPPTSESARLEATVSDSMRVVRATRSPQGEGVKEVDAAEV